MNPYPSPLFLSGRTDRVNQLAHVSVIDGGNNTSVGVNTGFVRGRENTSVGAYAGLLDATSRNSVLVGARTGASAQTAVETVAIGSRAVSNAAVVQQSVFVGSDAGSHARKATLTTAIGYAAGSQLSTAARTTVVGALSGQFAFNSLDDTFVGYASGRTCREGAKNAALGAFSGNRLERGEENVLVGFRAGANVETAERCVAVGAMSLEFAANASNVIAIGTGAGRYAANARDAIFIGGWSANAPPSASGGANNVVVGMNSGSGGADNVGVGAGVMPNVAGHDNVGIGTGAGAALDVGNSNVLVGSHAGANVVDGEQNVAVGVWSGNAGSNNTSVGFRAGGGVTGENNTSVGIGAGPVGASFLNTTMGANAAALLVGNDNVVVGSDAAAAGNAANNVIVGTRAATRVEGTRNIVVGADSYATLVGNDNVFVGTNAAWENPVDGSIIIGTDIDRDFDAARLANAVIIGSQVTISNRDSDSLVLYNRTLGDVVRASREAVTFGTGVLVTEVGESLAGSGTAFVLQDTYYPNNPLWEELPPFVVAEPNFVGLYSSYFGSYDETLVINAPLPPGDVALALDITGIYVGGPKPNFVGNGGYVDRYFAHITNDATAADNLWYNCKVFDTSTWAESPDHAVDGFWGPRSASLESTYDADAETYVIANVTSVESNAIWADVLETIPDQNTWRTYDVQPVRVQGLWYDKVRVHPAGIFTFCNDYYLGAATPTSAASATTGTGGVTGPSLYFGGEPLVMKGSYKLVVDDITADIDHIRYYGVDVQKEIDYKNCNKCTVIRWEGYRATDYAQSQLLVMEMTLYYGLFEFYPVTPIGGGPGQPPPVYVTQLESNGDVLDTFVRLAWNPVRWPFGLDTALRPIYFAGLDSCRLCAVPPGYRDDINIAYFVCPVAPINAPIEFSTWMAKYPALDSFECAEVPLASPITLFNNSYDRVFVFLDGSVAFGTPAQTANVPLLHVGKSPDADVSYLSYNNSVNQLLHDTRRPQVEWWRSTPATANAEHTRVRVELARLADAIPEFYIFELVFTPTDVTVVYSDTFQNVVPDATFLVAYQGAAYPIAHSSKKSYTLSTNDLPPHVFAGGRVLVDATGVSVSNASFHGDGGYLTNVPATSIVGDFSTEQFNLSLEGDGGRLSNLRAANVVWDANVAVPHTLRVYNGANVVVAAPGVLFGNGAGLYGIPSSGVVGRYAPNLEGGVWDEAAADHLVAWANVATQLGAGNNSLGYVVVSASDLAQANAKHATALVSVSRNSSGANVSVLHVNHQGANAINTFHIGATSSGLHVQTDVDCRVSVAPMMQRVETLASDDIAWTGNLALPGPYVFVGNGAGLTGVPANAIVGNITTNISSAGLAWTSNVTLPSPYLFIGNGAGLYNVPAAAIVGTVASGVTSDNITWNADLTLPTPFVFSGNGAGLTNIPAASIVGTVASGVTSDNITWNANLVLPEPFVFSGNGAGLSNIPVAAIAGLAPTDAANITWNANLTLPDPFVFTGNGAGLTNIPADAIVGTVATGVTSDNITWNANLVLPDPYVFTGNGAGLSNIPTDAIVGLPSTDAANIAWNANLVLPEPYGVYAGNVAANVLTTDALVADASGVRVTGSLTLAPAPTDDGCVSSMAGYGAAASTHPIVVLEDAGAFAGRLMVFVTNGVVDETNKTGFATVSVLASPADFEAVPVFVHKNVNLTTLDVGTGAGDTVVVQTDADCTVSWRFDGTLVR